MHLRQIVLTFLFGCMAIAFATIPGLMKGFLEGIERWGDLFSPLPKWKVRPRNSLSQGRLPEQTFMAVAGLVLIGLSVIAFIARL